MLYDLHEVSEAVGLAPVTLQSYTSRGKSDLVRGKDFIVRRTSPYRRQLMITDCGLQRLQMRAYRVFGDVRAPSRQFVWNGKEKLPPIVGSPQERRMRLKQVVASALRQYLDEHPCAVPNCPCIIHRLGVPQADGIVGILKDSKGPAFDGRAVSWGSRGPVRL